MMADYSYIYLIVAVIIIVLLLYKLNVQKRRIYIQDKYNNYLKNEINQLNYELEEYHYIASHDLSEPLRMITNYMSLLEFKYKDKFDNNANEYINFSVTAVQRMRDLLDDMVVFSNIKKDKFKIKDVNINEIINSLIKQLSIDKNIIDFKNLPIIRANKFQMKLVFYHLITNSLKFKSEKPLKITINYTHDFDTHYFAVSDNGIGIEKTYHDKIFHVFQKLHSKDESLGTGIGLAICKKIINQHGGYINIESEKNQGSTFNFTISKNLDFFYE